MDEVRDKLIELLNYASEHLMEFETENFNECLADHLIANGVTVQRWIPVEDRLPKEDGNVLVIVNGEHENKEFCGAYMLAEFFPSHGWILENYPDALNFDVTHWTPLPQALGKEGG